MAQERGFDFWMLRDPWANGFCVFQSESPDPNWPSAARGHRADLALISDCPCRIRLYEVEVKRAPPSAAPDAALRAALPAVLGRPGSHDDGGGCDLTVNAAVQSSSTRSSIVNRHR